MPDGICRLGHCSARHPFHVHTFARHALISAGLILCISPLAISGRGALFNRYNSAGIAVRTSAFAVACASCTGRLCANRGAVFDIFPRAPLSVAAVQRTSLSYSSCSGRAWILTVNCSIGNASAIFCNVLEPIAGNARPCAFALAMRCDPSACVTFRARKRCGGCAISCNPSALAVLRGRTRTVVLKNLNTYSSLRAYFRGADKFITLRRRAGTAQ